MNMLRCQFLLMLTLVLTPAICLGQNSGFDDLDTDSDGKVTKKEFKEHAESKLPDFDQLDKFVDRVDADKDGAISEDEFDGRREVLQALNQEMLNGGDTKKEMSKEQLKMIEEATKAYKATTKSASQGDWKKATKGMTKKASDDYAVGVVTQSMTLTQVELPERMNIPAINDAKKETLEVIEEYELDDVDISAFMRDRGRGGAKDNDEEEGGDDDMTPQEKAKAKQVERKAKQDKAKVEVLKAIDKDDLRWEIITKLRKSSKGAAFLRDALAGKISDSDVDDKTVFLTVTQATPMGASIPSVLKMKDDKGVWKYDGIDPVRTQKALMKTIQRMRGGAVPAGPKTDF